ncbi:unnamed protein product, partial [Protopolystoma xenopodis]
MAETKLASGRVPTVQDQGNQGFFHPGNRRCTRSPTTLARNCTLLVHTKLAAISVGLAEDGRELAKFPVVAIATEKLGSSYGQIDE